ncbi:MAG TPA: glycosyltransferase family 61 protein [Opitutus sp.]|nr:glycosyltransferase family 61 protein [Opitutus sp.]
MSPRKLAKSVLFHARGARIRALAAPRQIPWVRRRLNLPGNQPFDPLGAEATAGVRVTRLDAPATYQRPLPALPDQHPDAFDFFAQRRHETSSAAYVMELAGGIAWGHPTGGVFTPDGRFVPALTHDPCGEKFHTVWTRVRLPRPEPLAGRVLYLVTPEATDNFHHWMIDLLPRVGLVRRAGFEPQAFDHVIVNHTSRRYQLATLEHLGFRREQLVRADESLFVRPDLLVVPSLKESNKTLPAPDAAFLRAAFLTAPAPMARSRRIFISRTDAGFRRLSNEAALHPLLREHGFEIVCPGTLDLPGQARLFAEAEVIAGPAGAGFANLVFASPGARVIEIAPPGWLAEFHWMVSARLGLQHTVLLGEGRVMRGVPDVSDRERDIVIDPQKFAAVLERNLAAAPLSP